jgi:hypothetical protein
MISETTKILHYHLYWISIGLLFENILTIRRSLWNSFPQRSGKEIQMHIVTKNKDLTAIIKELAPVDNENFD